MSRSDHNGCGKACGLCHPQKKWKHQMSKMARMKPSVRRKIQKGKDDE